MPKSTQILMLPNECHSFINAFLSENLISLFWGFSWKFNRIFCFLIFWMISIRYLESCHTQKDSKKSQGWNYYIMVEICLISHMIQCPFLFQLIEITSHETLKLFAPTFSTTSNEICIDTDLDCNTIKIPY